MKSRLPLLFLGSLMVLQACKDEQVPPCDDYKSAYAFIQDQVAAKLLSPGSAVFPDVPEDRLAASDIIIAKKEGCAFGISSYVDSQNGFGALLRSNFSADVKYDKATQRWYTLRLFVAPN